VAEESVQILGPLGYAIVAICHREMFINGRSSTWEGSTMWKEIWRTLLGGTKMGEFYLVE